MKPSGVSVGATFLALAGALHAQEAKPLKLADLSVAGITVDEDSGAVRRHLGTPTVIDSAGWQYPDLSIIWKAGKVRILSLGGPSRSTRRGLRVGDSASRAVSLYSPCHADSTLVQVCFNPDDFDERAVIAITAGGRVTRINVGRIIEP